MICSYFQKSGFDGFLLASLGKMEIVALTWSVLVETVALYYRSHGGSFHLALYAWTDHDSLLSLVWKSSKLLLIKGC